MCHVSIHLRWDNGGSEMTQFVKNDDSLPKVKEMGKESNFLKPISSSKTRLDHTENKVNQRIIYNSIKFSTKI